MKTVKSILSAHAKTIKSLTSLVTDLNKEEQVLLVQQETLDAKVATNDAEHKRATAAISYLGGLFDAV